MAMAAPGLNLAETAIPRWAAVGHHAKARATTHVATRIHGAHQTGTLTGSLSLKVLVEAVDTSGQRL